jgi:hypothetical protein
MLTKRMKVSIVSGAILGIVCIIGAWTRSGFEQDAYYFLAFWYNRLLMGIVIGLAGGELGLPKAIYRGAALGLLVSFAFYSSTGFYDLTGFLVGIIYGMIIEFAAIRYAEINSGVKT